jgi:hypothetical protein
MNNGTANEQLARFGAGVDTGVFSLPGSATIAPAGHGWADQDDQQGAAP